MAQAGRDIRSTEMLQHLNSLYNDLAVIGHILSPQQAKEYREAVLHCIASLHAVREEPVLHPSQHPGIVLEFRPVS